MPWETLSAPALLPSVLPPTMSPQPPLRAWWGLLWVSSQLASVLWSPVPHHPQAGRGARAAADREGEARRSALRLKCTQRPWGSPVGQRRSTQCPKTSFSKGEQNARTAR